MKRIVVVAVVAVAVVAIALLARSQFADRSAVAAPAELRPAPSEAGERASPEGGRRRSGEDGSAAPGALAADDAPRVGERDAAARPAGGRTAPGEDDATARPAGPVGTTGRSGTAGAAPTSGASGTERTGEMAAPEPRHGGAASEPAPSGSDGSPGARGSAGRAAQMPSPETVLERAAAAYENVRSLRADFVQRLENTLLGSTATSRGTIYQRRPDRFLMRFTDPAGDVIVGDGEHFWIYYPSIDEAQVIRTPMGAGGAGGVDLQAQFLGDPGERFDATLDGAEAVDGRSAYVLTLDPKQPLGYEELKVWVDAEDHLVRRFEIREPNGVVRRIELSDLAVNPALEDSLFRFTPPAGARVVDRG